ATFFEFAWRFRLLHRFCKVKGSGKPELAQFSMLASAKNVCGVRRQELQPAAAVAAAMRAASRKAAIRLAGFARPVPALSKAVPWSGEVRTKGRRRVTWTASSKARVLIGIRA